MDTVTKPVQGLFDLVEGTASAMKELAGPSTGGGRRTAASGLVDLELSLNFCLLYMNCLNYWEYML